MTDLNSATERQLLPVATAGESWAWLGRAVRTRSVVAAAGVVTAALGAAATVLPVYMFGVLIDRVRESAPISALGGIVAIIAVAAIAAGVFTGLAGYFVAVLGSTVLARLREAAVVRTLRLPMRTVEQAGKGDVLARVGDDVAVIDKAVSEAVPPVISALFLVAVSLTTMVGIDWRLGLAGAIAVPMYTLALRWYLPRSAPRYAAQRVAMGARSQALISSIQGQRTVRAYGTEAVHRDLVDQASDRARLLGIDVFGIFARFASRGNRAEYVSLACILAAGFVLVDNGSVSVGQVTAAALLFHQLFNPIAAILFTFDEVQSAGASLARLVGVVSIQDPPPPADLRTPSDSGLQLSGIRHGYDGHEVLHGIDLMIAPGERIALVGPTGSGKSTLASIAAGSIIPDSGEVLLGGVPLAELTGTIRDHLVIVTQEVHTFAGTLRDDLRLAAPHADDRAVELALASVGATGWVRALPAGVDTVVGEGGHRLTAAQAQQLALARVLLVDPAVVVLDEATAEAGSAGARDLESAAAAAVAARTSLVVAHRLTQAATADRIVVLEHGLVCESGTHEALVAAGGRYARLWATWSGDSAVGDSVREDEGEGGAE
ncbi:ATP-binding cassette subfamily C protein [Rhodococcus sp. SMB37]|uniref:ABC transporter ATP-binding protein n=1 Tax=Rhodococcus sp. SMB37 TaxID=2512213 RepID=UPI001051CECF|nr:ABC transporter ATP-binding protein [Rhodococcus sp. SMB37]TCN49497.1 ATP-binding cassette subfamily C protein [Rhodococcus sp. SMB37]